MAGPSGKTALITGSTDGVGRMVAERLGQDGWRVLVHGRDRGTSALQVVASINDGWRFRRIFASRAFPLLPMCGV